MVVWRKNSRAQMMAKQRVAVCRRSRLRPSTCATRHSTIVDIAAPIKGLESHPRK
jgi:hypothetical protein